MVREVSHRNLYTAADIRDNLERHLGEMIHV